MTNLISENKSQIMEFATAECENGNQNKQNIIDQLKDSFIEFKIGWVTKAVDKTRIFSRQSIQNNWIKIP
jgi:NAD+--asparagine ADP-ribosyltransferase